MKAKLIWVIIIPVFLFSGCKKEGLVLPDALVLAKTNLTAEFAILDQNMAAAAAYLGTTNMDTTLIRAKLLELANGTDDFTEFGWVTPSGILQIIEPSAHYGSQGADISQQTQVIKTFETKLPVLSQVFRSVDGLYGAVMMHPVMKNNSISGAISAWFYPEKILANIMRPLLEGQTFELWVMEKGGRMIFNQDANEIGLNLFTDPLYKDFSELLAAGEKIDTEESGTTSYSFYQTGTSVTVTKKTYWTTYELYGTQWKLVWVKPE